jgi:hypothetical protein
MVVQRIGLLLLSLLAGCSTEAWYEGMQQSAQEACRTQRNSAADACTAGRYSKPYSTFEKERSELKP